MALAENYHRTLHESCEAAAHVQAIERAIFEHRRAMDRTPWLRLLRRQWQNARRVLDDLVQEQVRRELRRRRAQEAVDAA